MAYLVGELEVVLGLPAQVLTKEMVEALVVGCEVSRESLPRIFFHGGLVVVAGVERTIVVQPMLRKTQEFFYLLDRRRLILEKRFTLDDEKAARGKDFEPVLR